MRAAASRRSSHSHCRRGIGRCFGQRVSSLHVLGAEGASEFVIERRPLFALSCQLVRLRLDHVGFAAPAAGSRRQPCGGADATATAIAGAAAAAEYEYQLQPEVLHEPGPIRWYRLLGWLRRRGLHLLAWHGKGDWFVGHIRGMTPELPALPLLAHPHLHPSHHPPASHRTARPPRPAGRASGTTSTLAAKVVSTKATIAATTTLMTPAPLSSASSSWSLSAASAAASPAAATAALAARGKPSHVDKQPCAQASASWLSEGFPKALRRLRSAPPDHA